MLPDSSQPEEIPPPIPAGASITVISNQAPAFRDPTNLGNWVAAFVDALFHRLDLVQHPAKSTMAEAIAMHG